MDSDNFEREMIGIKIRTARMQAGLTQTEAAEKLGLTQSHLSMLETGKRRLTAELAGKIFELYGIESAVFPERSRSGVTLAEETLQMLERIAEKSGSARLIGAVDSYMSLCGYLMLRSLYYVNPSNRGNIFSADSGSIEFLSKVLCCEPEKVKIFAEESREVKRGNIEPSMGEIESFRRIVRACEERIISTKKREKEENT